MSFLQIVEETKTSTNTTMHPVPDYQIISATALAAPLAVLLLASINGLLENCGQSSRNAIVISKTALCIAR